MKTLRLTLVLLSALSSQLSTSVRAAAATRAAVEANIDTQFPSNQPGAITAEKLRLITKQIADSAYMPLTDGTPATAAAVSAAFASVNSQIAALDSDVSALSSGKQNLDPDLTAIAALTTTAFGRSSLSLVDAAAGRTLFGVVIGTNVQAQSSALDALVAGTPSLGAATATSVTSPKLVMPTAGAPFSLATAAATFNAVRDDMCLWGYNITAGTAGAPADRIDAAEPSLLMRLEANVRTNGGLNLMEANLDYQGADGLMSSYRRAYLLQANRSTHALSWVFTGDFTIYPSEFPVVNPIFKADQSTGYVTVYNRLDVGGPLNAAGRGYFSGGLPANVEDCALLVTNNRIVTFLDAASGFTDCGFIWYDSANVLNFGQGNSTRLQLTATKAAFTHDTEATTGGAGALTSAGGIFAAKKIIAGGTITGAARLEATGSGSDVVVASPDGTRWKITVSNAGVISATSL